MHTRLTALSGGSYNLELRRDKVFDFQVTTEAGGSDDVVIRVSARGAAGISFHSGQTISLLKMQNFKQWSSAGGSRGGYLACAYRLGGDAVGGRCNPDDRLSDRMEITGTATLQIRP